MLEPQIDEREMLWKEKAALLESRFGVRMETEVEKRQLVYKVEQLMKKGKLKENDLAELGLVEIDEKEELST